MKLPAFDYNEQKWDKYKHFYNDPEHFIQFVTGELLCKSVGKSWDV